MLTNARKTSDIIRNKQEKEGKIEIQRKIEGPPKQKAVGSNPARRAYNIRSKTNITVRCCSVGLIFVFANILMSY